jgi:anti-sigma B factor antagonist
MRDETAQAIRPGKLRWRSTQRGKTHVVSLIGELDAGASTAVEAELLKLERDGAERIVVNLTGLEFIDSTGIAMLIAAWRRSEQDGDRLRFIPSRSPDVQRLFELCGIDRAFPTVDLGEAFRITPPRAELSD